MKYLLPLLLLAVLAPAQTPPRQHLKSKVAQERHLPFSSGVLVGDTLYLAGATGIDPDTPNKAAITPEAEAHLVLDRIQQVVEQAGMHMDDLVQLQVYCTDLANYDAFNNVYKTYFKGDFPARAFIGVPNLLFGARYEVMGIAIRNPATKE